MGCILVGVSTEVTHQVNATIVVFLLNKCYDRNREVWVGPKGGPASIRPGPKPPPLQQLAHEAGPTPVPTPRLRLPRHSAATVGRRRYLFFSTTGHNESKLRSSKAEANNARRPAATQAVPHAARSWADCGGAGRWGHSASIRSQRALGPSTTNKALDCAT